MPKQLPHPDEQQLIARVLSFRDDPLGFVLFAFPWGKENTPLATHVGPRTWQREALEEIGAHIQKNLDKVARDQIPELLKMARASGRGIGKSAFLAWIALWLFCCRPSSTIIVSANTEQQLKSTTFPEIRKWATMSIVNRWFEHNIMSLQPAEWLTDNLKATSGYDDAYWYIQAKLWSEENPDAYAGPHSQMGMAVLFDEASGITGCVWPVAQGYFTDKTVYRFWIAISNPRNPSGAFFECFHGNRGQWNHKTIDGRSVTENDPGVYDSIIKQYGVDSDQARVEVYGKFPQQGDDHFMSRGEVEDAVERELMEDAGAPMVMGVDPARMGRDKAVIWFRQGRDARSIKPIVYPKCTTEEMAEYCAMAIIKYKPDHICIEADGVGGPVIELLKKMSYSIHEVHAGKAAQDKDAYYLRRTEIWGRMRDWVSTACLPKHDELEVDLCSMRYTINLKGQLALWPKEKMKKEGFASPDYADALAMTFCKTFGRKDMPSSRRHQRKRVAKDINYPLFS